MLLVVHATQAQAKAAADKAQHQHQQQQSAAATAAAAAGSGSTPQQQGPAPPAAVRASEGALECASQLRAKLEGAEASAAVLINKPELKAARRAVERKITMWVSQISGTQQQVRDKSLQLIEVSGVLNSWLASTAHWLASTAQNPGVQAQPPQRSTCWDGTRPQSVCKGIAVSIGWIDRAGAGGGR